MALPCCFSKELRAASKQKKFYFQKIADMIDQWSHHCTIKYNMSRSAHGRKAQDTRDRLGQVGLDDESSQSSTGDPNRRGATQSNPHSPKIAELEIRYIITSSSCGSAGVCHLKRMDITGNNRKGRATQNRSGPSLAITEWTLLQIIGNAGRLRIDQDLLWQFYPGSGTISITERPGPAEFSAQYLEREQ